MQNLATITAIAVAGALGTLARYGLGGLAHRILGTGFAWGTLAVNLAGCLIIGMLLAFTTGRGMLPEQWRIPLTVGFCGAFTTFSAFGYETLRFIQDESWLLALGNVLLNVILGLGMVWLGLVAARVMAGGA